MSDEPLSPTDLLRAYAETVERLELVLKRKRTDLEFCEARMLRYEEKLAEAISFLRWFVEMAGTKPSHPKVAQARKFISSLAKDEHRHGIGPCLPPCPAFDKERP